MEAKPDWLKVRAPGGENYKRLKKTLRELDLYTVCEEARCPNVGECWSAGTATVMLLGHTCTRGCRFCSVTTGNPGGVADPREPEHVARAISGLGLRYVVLTMVDRDDLFDGGASHVAEAVVQLKRYQPDLLVETLVGDFRGRRSDIASLQSAAPDVYAHNIETVRRLTPSIRDPRCGYSLSLRTLQHAKALAPDRLTKSSIMVGLGESNEEIFETLQDLREHAVDVVTLGQYLRPTQKHAPVARYATPDEFKDYERVAKELGFAYVASGPLVRSSYHAAEAFIAARLRPGAQLPEGQIPHYVGAEALDQANRAADERSPLLTSGPVLVPASHLTRRRSP